jgi:hypothetical protein
MLKLPGHTRYAYSPIVERPDYSEPGGKRLALYMMNRQILLSAVLRMFMDCDPMSPNVRLGTAERNAF